MSGDADYPSVSLLLHCDGTDGSTTFTDSSPTPKTVTRSGDAHIETDQSKFGGASAYFDGNGDYLTIANNAAFNFGTGDFTVEFWMRIPIAWSSQSSSSAIIGQKTNDASNGWVLYRDGNYPTKILVRVGGNNSLLSTSVPAQNTWEHWAIARSGTTLRLFKDGVLEGSATNSVNVTEASAPLLIGLGTGWAGSYLNAYMDDIRITKGVARYTADFTPPAAAFPSFAGQIAGVITDDASDPVARVVRAYRRDTGALVGNTTSSAADGSYSMDLLTLDQCSVIALDDAAGDLFNDLIARVTPA